MCMFNACRLPRLFLCHEVVGGPLLTSVVFSVSGAMSVMGAGTVHAVRSSLVPAVLLLAMFVACPPAAPVAGGGGAAGAVGGAWCAAAGDVWGSGPGGPAGAARHLLWSSADPVTALEMTFALFCRIAAPIAWWCRSARRGGSLVAGARLGPCSHFRFCPLHRARVLRIPTPYPSSSRIDDRA